MNDRLGEVLATEEGNDSDQSLQGKKGRRTMKWGRLKRKKQKKADINQEIFVRAVEDVKRRTRTIVDATQVIGTLGELASRATTTEDDEALSTRLQCTIHEANKEAKHVKTLLSELKEENEKLKEAGALSESDLRIRNNVLNVLTKQFILEMTNYQSSQLKYKAGIRAKAKRQISVVKPNATDEEIDEIMKSEGGRDALYKQMILDGYGINEEVKTVSAKVVGKFQDVKALEQSVAEVHQMFLDFALFVGQQEELLDNIEHQLQNAHTSVGEANEDLKRAIKEVKAKRKKQICTSGVLGVAGVIVLLVLL